MDGKIDYFVAGVGTGGTITGAGSFLKERDKDLKVIAVEPATLAPCSPAAGPARTRSRASARASSRRCSQRDLLDEIIAVDDEDAIETARLAARREGVLCGISCGAALWAALQIAERPEAKGKRIAVVLPDSGERYVSHAVLRPRADPGASA